MKLKLIFTIALVMGVIAVQAATENTAPVAVADTSAISATPAAPADMSASNAAPADAVTALFGDPVIVKAKNFTIKRSDLDNVLTGAKASASAAGQPLPPDFDAQILNQLIYIQLLKQRATDADRVAGEHDAAVQFTNILKHFGSEEAFERQLKAVNMTAEQLRAKATEEAVARAALRRELNVNTTDSEAQDYYTNHPSDFEAPEMVHVQHILLLTMDPATRQPLPADQVQAKRKQIEDLLKRARGGEDFTKLAGQYSEDPGSKDKGGELAPFPRGQMVPEFEAAAFSLPTNQISDVITTAYGFHIIKVLGKTPAKKEGLDSVVDETGHTTVMDNLKEALSRQKLAKLAPAYIEKLKVAEDVQIVDPTLNAMMTALEAASTNAPAGASQ